MKNFIRKYSFNIFFIAMKMTFEVCKQRVLCMQASNELVGFRGCRIAVTYPEITSMQTTAIISAAIRAKKEGIVPQIQISIPLVCTDHELDDISRTIHAAAEQVFRVVGETIPFSLGAQLEVPRACMRAEDIVREGSISFVTFGINRLIVVLFSVFCEIL